MKAYVVTTGILFALLVLAHIWRAIGEGGGLATDPGFIAITSASACMSLWAFFIARRAGWGSC